MFKAILNSVSFLQVAFVYLDLFNVNVTYLVKYKKVCVPGELMY